MYFRLTGGDLRNLAFQYVQVNNFKMPINWYDNRCAAEDWLYSFFKRNNDLSVRTTQGTSLNRATSFNKHNIK